MAQEIYEKLDYIAIFSIYLKITFSIQVKKEWHQLTLTSDLLPQG